MNWFLVAFKKYAEFSGRAQRAEYWYYILFYFIIYIFLVFLDISIMPWNTEPGMVILGAIFSLVMFIPTLAVGVRRLHDTNRSGWWLLISLVPLIGGIVLLIFLVQDSTPGDNSFGPNPKAVAA